jgi:hypothetical protein
MLPCFVNITQYSFECLGRKGPGFEHVSIGFQIFTPYGTLAFYCVHKKDMNRKALIGTLYMTNPDYGVTVRPGTSFK